MIQKKSLIVYLNIVLIFIQFLAIVPITPKVKATTTVTTYTIQDTYRDSYKALSYHYDTLINPIQINSWDAYNYLVFNQVLGNASWLVSAILSLPCYSADDYATTDYATVYGLKNPDLAHLLTEPTTPVTTNYSNLQINSSWSGWKNVTVTDIVKEIMMLGTWVTSDNIPFKIIEPFNASQPDRYIYDYSNNSTGAKLYIELYDDLTSKPYNGGWDQGILVNGTPYYDVWTVWNGTITNGYVCLIDNTTDAWYFYPDITTDSNRVKIQDISGSASTSNHGNHLTQTVNDVFYILLHGYNGGNTYVVLFYTSNGLTWNYVNIISGSYSATCLAYQSSTNQLWCIYNGASYCKYKTYDLDTSTLSGEIDMPDYNNRMVMVFDEDGSDAVLCGQYNSAGLKIGTSSYNSGTGFGSITQRWTNGIYTFCTDFIVSGNSIHLFMVFNDSSDDEMVGFYYDEGTWDSWEGVTTSSTNRFANVYMESIESVRVFYWRSTATSGYYYRIRTGGLTQSWGSATSFDATPIISSAEAVNQNWVVKPLFAVSENSAVDEIYDAFDDTPIVSVATDIDLIIPITLNTVGANYTQLHYINCTWTNPIIDPDPIPPEPDPPDPIIGDTNRIKLYILLVGLTLVTSGLYKFAHGFNFAEVGVIAFVILVGACLIISIQYM